MITLYLQIWRPGSLLRARGLRRDQVRLLVSKLADDRVCHTVFHRLPDLLEPGDVLAINTSGTFNAVLGVERSTGQKLKMHLSTRFPGGLWSIELRTLTREGTHPFYTAQPGEHLSLPGGGSAKILRPYRHQPRLDPISRTMRLWIASLELPLPVSEYLACYGAPIRYNYIKRPWPISYYQTAYATETGSAEMPSAGRAFTPELITRLVARGIRFAPLILHTGVASLEYHEPPYEEYYRIPPSSAQQINTSRKAGGRVVAVGTTVVRALETVADHNGSVHPKEGWTDLVITPQDKLRAVDALLTGFHEPRATHLAMLQALASLNHLRKTYTAALQEGYLWHEFGDLHLILP